MGEGTTVAGFKVAKSIFRQPFYGGGHRAGAGEPYEQSLTPYGQPSVGRADGGEAPDVPIVAAGGEYVIHPDDVAWLGDGSMDDGHRILDEFVKQYRAETVKTLKTLPGPAHG
jgi:hypothetical protein